MHLLIRIRAGIEREAPHARGASFLRVPLHPTLARERDECTLGRVANASPGAIRKLEIGLTAQRSTPQERMEERACRVGDRAVIDEERATWSPAETGGPNASEA